MSRNVSGAQGCVAVVLVVVLFLGVAVGLDLLAAQFVCFALSGYHVASGIWHAFMAVIALEFIVSLAAGSGSKVANR